MGCSHVYMLGTDQYFNIDGKTHFWQYLPNANKIKRSDGYMACKPEQASAFIFNNLAYTALKSFSKEKNCHIYNCSLKSTINIFPKMSFEEALKL